MTALIDSTVGELEQDGLVVLPTVFSADQVDAMRSGLTAALEEDRLMAKAVLSQDGAVYAARNVLALWPPAADIWRAPPVPEILQQVLGPAFGLVRALYFDKPPERTWSLPWHKDLTIAVQDNRRRSLHFSKPTCKAGVPHMEASLELLQAMVTVRVHLDDITEENGPLRVVPGSHLTGKKLQIGTDLPRSVLVKRGDVLLIRPLTAHSSIPSHPGTRRHRRILHLEFSGWPELPDGYRWHRFIRGGAGTP
jgi:ectoine hydroxylase-related dioxygenase (phytanoyl-CoA dioxygenase family)